MLQSGHYQQYRHNIENKGLIIRWIRKLRNGKDAGQPQKTQHSSTRKQDRGSENHATPENAAQTGGPPAAKNPNRRKRRPKRSKSADNVPAWDISMFAVPEVEGKTRFHDLGLAEPLLHAIFDLGFEYCLPIQGQILPYTLRGDDAIGKAQTGTGKTAAFLITIIDSLLKQQPSKDRPKRGVPKALIIAPTRELATQIADEARMLAKYSDLRVTTLIGGIDFKKQQRTVAENVLDIVVATPGRLLDFMDRKNIFLDQVQSLVLDEADRMLDMGFIPQVKRILRAVPETKERQTQLFSATFTQEIVNLSERWTHKPAHVEIEPENVATETVQQKVYLVSNEEKLRCLLNILRQAEVTRVIVFVNRRDQAQRLFDKISRAKLRVGMLSGEVSQHKRTRTLQEFKNGKIDVLVATDVAGRGIHVDGVSHVINYNLPENPQDYVHRIGRTGRAGASGISINLACEDESFQIPAIEELLGYKFVCELPPEES